MAKGASGLAARIGSKILSLGLNPETPRLTVGVWGTKETGKTTFLSLLPAAVNGSRWTVQPSDAATEAFLARASKALFQAGRFPDPPAEREPQAYMFSVRRPRTYLEKVAGRRRAYTITFLDASGDWCERKDSVRLGSPDNPIEYLVGCEAILCFLDPVRMRYEGSEYASVLIGAFDGLRRRLEIPLSGKLPHRVAFIVPKVDEEGLWSNRSRAERYVMEQFGMTPFQDLTERFRPSHYRFFACSSVGRIDGRSNCERQDELSVILSPDRIEPFRLFDPIEWMILNST